ncbi:hypothetical protein [Pseudomonas laurylsulfativorans]|nr:hypothetical protein [Pseudomonas laurylsulfativorans]
MERAYIIMSDGEDFDFPRSVCMSDLFPENYCPAVSSNQTVVNIKLFGGEARFIFGEAEVECYFDFYEQDEELFEDTGFEGQDDYVRGLLNYVAKRIGEACGREAEWNGT